MNIGDLLEERKQDGWEAYDRFRCALQDAGALGIDSAADLVKEKRGIVSSLKSAADGSGRFPRLYWDDRVRFFAESVAFLNSAAAALEGGKELRNPKPFDIGDFFSSSEEWMLHLLVSMHPDSSGERRGVNDLAALYGCSRETIRRKLRLIEEGFSHLGCRIEPEIAPAGDLARADAEWMRTTVHPVFLALNLGEVYGLMMSLGQVALDGDAPLDRSLVARRVMGEVSAQLSRYARGIIAGSLEDNTGGAVSLPDPIDPSFHVDSLDGGSVLDAAAYCSKAGIAVAVYRTGSGLAAVSGRILRFSVDCVDIVEEDGTRHAVPTGDIVSIAPYWDGDLGNL